MGSLSDYAELKLLDHVFKVASYTPPTNIYVALSTADPLDTGAGIAEPGAGSYARKVFNTWNIAAARSTSNNGQIEFVEATGSWGTITHWALFDALSAGNMLTHGSFTASKVIDTGDTARIKDTELDISYNSGGFSTYLSNELLDHLLKVGAYTVPTNVYLALSTANPTDDASGIAEPVGSAYARLLQNDWDAAVAGVLDNTNDDEFVEATGSWGTIGWAATYDAITSGNMLSYGAVGTAKAIGSGDVARFPAGDYDITLD